MLTKPPELVRTFKSCRWATEPRGDTCVQGVDYLQISEAIADQYPIE